MDLKLKGRRAMVSGSTAGIGRAIAASLAREGASVIVNGRGQSPVDKAVAELKAATGGDLVGFAGDLGTAASADELADTIAAQWAGADVERYTVLTGGEPLLQVDTALIEALHARGFSVGVETNGTIAPPDGMDWICVSPKAGADLVVRRGHELKLVYPQAGVDPARFEGLAFERFALQPMDGPDRDAATRAAIAYCLAHPRWRLSLQTHKYLGIP